MNTITVKLGKVLPENIKNHLYKKFVIKILMTPKPFLTFKVLIDFLFSKRISIKFKERIYLIKRFLNIDNKIICAHYFDELLITTTEILKFPKSLKGCIVEAGVFKGGGTAKLSIVAKLCNRKLFVFDSFEGLPPNKEPVANTTMGYSANFDEGEYKGTLEEVKKAVKKFGEIKYCEFIKGYFNKTMPKFKKNILVVFCDVDLESSNKDCLKFLWPNIVKKGLFFSQDAHIPIIKKLFLNKKFWKQELKTKIPEFKHITKRFGYFKK